MVTDFICQFAAVCNKCCSHRWPHKKTDTLGCSDQGCSNLIFPYLNNRHTLVDEFGEAFSEAEISSERHTLQHIKCVNFEYYLQNTSPGHIIITKDTIWEGWHERERLKKEQLEREVAEKLRQNRCDYKMSIAHMQSTSEEIAINPLIDKEENEWPSIQRSSRYSYSNTWRASATV